MDYDEDDLPDGYPDFWSRTVRYLVLNRQKWRGKKKGKPPPTENTVRWPSKSRVVKFFEKLGPTDDWRENRRIYNRKKDRR